MALQPSAGHGVLTRRMPAQALPTARVWIIDHAGLVLMVLLLAAALAPVATTPIPAMVDYVNHLSRMYLLAADGTADASPVYRVTWAIFPNLAMDLLVPQLARAMSVETATRMFLMASQVLVVTGAAAIELAVKRRIAIAGPVAVLFLYSVPFAWGFLNFEFAFGIALWGIAAWLALAGRAWMVRLAVHAVFVVFLFGGHFFALGLYGFTLGVHELWLAWASRRSPRAVAGTMTMLASPAVILGAAMHADGGSIGGPGNVWFLEVKPFWPFAILNGYSVLLSCIEALCLIVLVYLLAKHRAIRLTHSCTWLGVGFALLYVALPSVLLDTAFSDIRVLVAAPLVLAAFVEVTLSVRWRTIAGVVVVGLALVNIGTAAAVFASYKSTYHAMIGSFAKLETGARVLVGHSGVAEDPPMTHLADYPLYHAPTLAAHYAKAFVPTVFTTVGKQPLSPIDALKGLAFSCGGPAPVSLLASLARGTTSPARAPAFVRNWTRDFDYLYVLGNGLAANPMPDMLEALESHPDFTLYRIRTSNHQDLSPGPQAITKR